MRIPAVKITCQRASCDARLVFDDVGEGIKTAVEGGWRHDGWGWWCAAHLPASDTLPCPVTPAPTSSLIRDEAP